MPAKATIEASQKVLMTQPDSPPAALSSIARLRLNADLAGLWRKRQALHSSQPMFTFNIARIAAQQVKIMRQLGLDLDGGKREKAAFAGDAVEAIAEPRAATAKHFDFDA